MSEMEHELVTILEVGNSDGPIIADNRKSVAISLPTSIIDYDFHNRLFRGKNRDVHV